MSQNISLHQKLHCNRRYINARENWSHNPLWILRILLIVVAATSRHYYETFFHYFWCLTITRKSSAFFSILAASVSGKIGEVFPQGTSNFDEIEYKRESGVVCVCVRALVCWWLWMRERERERERERRLIGSVCVCVRKREREMSAKLVEIESKRDSLKVSKEGERGGRYKGEEAIWKDMLLLAFAGVQKCEYKTETTSERERERFDCQARELEW